MNDISLLMAGCYKLAERSPDPSNQNGAIILRGRRIVGFGCNYFPAGVDVEACLADRSLKYKYVIHAEIAAVYDTAASQRVQTGDIAMVTPWAACLPCSLSIVGSGVKRLYIHKQRCQAYAATREEGKDWQPELDEACVFMKKAGVEIIEFDGPIEHYYGDGIMLNGRKWNPRTCT